MTATARKILEDCRYAHELLELEEEERKFRLLWVSCSSLLRAVGHVLHKVDGARNIEFKKAIDVWWKELNNNKNKHPIFFEFIVIERNNILKEYEIGMFSGEIDVLVSSTGESFSLSETAFCPMSYGKFAGEDCRDIANEAIKWWEFQLDAIENKSP